MLHDGFGEDLTVDEILRDEEEYFVRNARHALVKKAGRGFPAGADEDAIQEARIAAWQSWEKHHNRTYLAIAARQRLIAHVYRDQWFGTKPSAHEKDPIRRDPGSRSSLDDPNVSDVLTAADAIDQVALAYHYGEIHEALDGLTFTQKEMVVLKFWGGMSNPEIAAIQGKTAGGVSSSWSKYIRPHLVEQLKHLQGAS